MTIHQPFVHDLVGAFAAPIQAWAQPSGSMNATGAEGIFLSDDRIVATYSIGVEGRYLTGTPQGTPRAGLAPSLNDAPGHVTRGELSSVAAHTIGATKNQFVDVVSLEGLPVDPVVRMVRSREATIRGIRETITVRSAADYPLYLRVSVDLGIDATSMAVVKDPHLAAKHPVTLPTITLGPSSVDAAPSATWSWREGTTAELSVVGTGPTSTHPTLRLLSPSEADANPSLPTLRAEADLTIAPDSAQEFTWMLTARDAQAPFVGLDEPSLTRLTSVLPNHATDEHRRVHDLLFQSLADLSSLRLCRAGNPGEAFFAAGAPWFFTLFGRDSLIAASLLMPVTSDIAERTVRTLASQQGNKVSADTAEQPGKILHEVRAEGMDMGDAFLPPVYFGTIDATGLWIQLVSDLEKQGADVSDLANNVALAADWLLNYADADGDFLLEYIDESGHGLANQGWKDSGDSVRFADGSIASGPIALCEVQAYAYEACLEAGRLLDTWGHENADALAPALRERAANIKEAFREHFWVEDERGPYIALALDGAKRPVTGVASNMGHLLGTGLLSASEERTVMDRLMDPTMFSGYGIRTLSSDNGAYSPNRYHGGSVWTHDTAYILRQSMRAGFEDEARAIARALLRAADGFHNRLPELFAGDPSNEVFPPLPYPASCRPQAWAAASAVPVARALGFLD